MKIRPSAAIRQNYNEIAEYCKTTGEPVYLTKNGEGDLVVMDIEAFEYREKMLRLETRLLEIERARLNGAKTYTVEEVKQNMKDAIERARRDNAALQSKSL